jgi:FkbM family methyltransferase
MIRFRPNTMDREIWDLVSNGKEYWLPKLNNTGVVLDIGMHIGSFSYYAAMQGALEVHGYEALKDNFELARENLSSLPQCHIYNKAVIRSDTKIPFVFTTDFENSYNTGSVNVLFKEHGRRVNTISLDDIVKPLLDRFDEIRFIKMDCEASEFPILLTCNYLDRVREIQLEFHEVGGKFDGLQIPEPFKISGYPEFTGEVLNNFLISKGFKTTTEGIGYGTLGKIRARR